MKIEEAISLVTSPYVKYNFTPEEMEGLNTLLCAFTIEREGKEAAKYLFGTPVDEFGNELEDVN